MPLVIPVLAQLLDEWIINGGVYGRNKQESNKVLQRFFHFFAGFEVNVKVLCNPENKESWVAFLSGESF